MNKGRRRLAGRLIVGIIFFSSMVTVVATAIQLSLEYSRDIRGINERFEQIRVSYLDAFSSNVWLVDTDRINILLDGILKLRDIHYAEIVDDKGAKLATAGIHEGGFGLLPRDYDLHYIFRGKPQLIGRLTVVADMKAVYLRTLERGAVILGSNAVKTFLVGLFIFFFVYRLITRHIETLAERARAYTARELDEPWGIDRPEKPGSYDEFDDLIDAFNQMRVNLRQSYKVLEKANQGLEASVSERTRELEESRLLLVDAVESLADGFVLFDAEERFVLCNKAYRKINTVIADLLVPGIKAEEIARALVTRDKIDSVAGDHEALIATRMARYRNPQGPWELRMSDGSAYLVNDFPTADGGRVVLRTDITELKQAEQSLRDISDFNQRIISESPVGITIFNADGQCITANNAIAVMIGATREQVLAQNFHKIKSWKNSGLYDAALRAIEKGEKQRHEIHIVSTFGKEACLDCQLVPFNVRGEARLMVTYSDVSKLKQARDQVRTLSRVVEQSPNMVIVTDEKGIIEYVNPTFVEITGFSEEEAIGQTPAIVRSASTSASRHKDLWETINAGNTWRAELEDRTKDGRPFWVATSISPVRGANGEITHYVSQQQDITARKEAERELKKAKEQAEIASKAKSELLANMSHELRTPLNAIIGFSSIIKEQAFGPVGNDRYSDYANDINASGVHLLELINDILDVSAVEAGKVELNIDDIDFTDVLNASLRLIRARAQEGGVIIRNNTPELLPLIRVDERRLKQILINLLSNAVKFTEEGVEVSISAHLSDAGEFVFEVSDQGIGMNKEDIEKALSPFGQADSGLDRKYQGTGLGLPLTIGLIELHGGSFLIDSERGKGTTVSVTFPPECVVKNGQATGTA
ncbi:MAG: PAS domain S-box protein [Rhodospirillales bacterium]|nr:PAS domain S-box protein [Rhodospirillales bacterium]